MIGLMGNNAGLGFVDAGNKAPNKLGIAIINAEIGVIIIPKAAIKVANIAYVPCLKSSAATPTTAAVAPVNRRLNGDRLNQLVIVDIEPGI